MFGQLSRSATSKKPGQGPGINMWRLDAKQSAVTGQGEDFVGCIEKGVGYKIYPTLFLWVLGVDTRERALLG